ncbi:hypothetical protein [Dactylosporangium salmoneum]|uniref:Thioesterase domain-containing protein n=1 Tax=Dactylosporangium salmoneum TaxID=53361 RepID=A0ABN3GTI0_9ACTN
MSSPHWRPLNAGTKALVLAVHFDPGAGGPGFADLAGDLAGARLYETLPPRSAGAFDEESEPVAYIRPWLAEIPALGAPVRAVLGYCAGSSLAGILAAQIARAGLGDPPLLVFAPQRVDAATLATEFCAAIDRLAAQLSPDELAAARHSAAAVQGEADLPAAAGALERAYRTAVEAATARLGVAPAMRRQLGDRFATYLAYLVACARAASVQLPAQAVLPHPPGGAAERVLALLAH